MKYTSLIRELATKRLEEQEEARRVGQMDFTSRTIAKAEQVFTLLIRAPELRMKGETTEQYSYIVKVVKSRNTITPTIHGFQNLRDALAFMDQNGVKFERLGLDVKEGK